MTRSCCVLASLFVGASFVGAQPLVIDPAHRPEDYSNIVGQYSIKAHAEPTEVHVEEAITLRIEITGAGPEKFEPNSKYLRLFPDSWKNDFYVQELHDRHEVTRAKKTWLFVYRLKPKHVKVKEIGDIRLVYYDPESRAKIKYVTKFVEPAIAIKVLPKLNTSGEKIVDVNAAPASFYQQIAISHALATPAILASSNVQLALFLAAPPFACLLGACAWRRYFLDEGRRARQHRDNSAARALAALRRENGSAWEVVQRYLRERFDFLSADVTPTEVAAFLKRRGFTKAIGEHARTFFRACDAARFNVGAVDAFQPLADEAVRLIEALEADPCARG